MNNIIVITRHSALVEYLREIGFIDEDTEVIPHCSDPEQIRGKTVIGHVTMHLAAIASSIIHIPLTLSAEDRGRELSLDEMRDRVGDPVEYEVRKGGHVLSKLMERIAIRELCRSCDIPMKEYFLELKDELHARWAIDNNLVVYNTKLSEKEFSEFDESHFQKLKKLYSVPKAPFEVGRRIFITNGVPAISIEWNSKPICRRHSGFSSYAFNE